MKKILLLFSLLLNITLRGMELSSMAPNGENHENKKIILQNDYKNFLAGHLRKYKEGSFPYIDIQRMENTYSDMTNKKSLSFLGDCLHKDVCDEEGNTFVHYAAKNIDLKTTEWAIKCMKRPLSIPNKLNKEPIDLCIDQLMPGELESNKESVYKVFSALVTGYDKIGFDYEHRRSFLKKIVTLEFEYIKRGTAFPFKIDDVLKYFSKQDIQLSDIYQEICDEEGNTFTHMLVSHHSSDMLYTFLIKNYITLAINKEKEDPVILAQKNLLKVGHDLFEQCAPNKDFDITKISQGDNKKKCCCYYMLLNLQKKMDGNTDFKQCCDKHLIEKN
jgi:hypothetical protein